MGASTLTFLVGRVGRFLEEAGRRRVWRSALAYGAVVFVLLQLAEIVFPAFGAPPWALRLLVVSSFLGLPPVLCLAWIFDLTRTGIRKTGGEPQGEGSAGGVRGFPAALPRIALMAVTLATVGGLGWWTVQDTVGDPSLPDAGGEDGSLLDVSREEAPVEVRSLAVLPLDDFSQEESGGYFTAGFHEELIAQLSQLGAARVVSRTSVVSYDRTGKAMPVIAQELGVEGVLEGSVFRDGNRVRITVQLIYAPGDRHLWANSYEGTLEDAITLQGEVARAIAEEIQALLLPGGAMDPRKERIALDPRALEEYRKGRLEQARATPEGLTEAIQHFQASARADSSFAPALAGLAVAQFLLNEQSTDSAAPARRAPEGRLEVARHLQMRASFKEAEQVVRRVIQDSPASTEAWEALAHLRTIRGDYGGAVEVWRERAAARAGEPGEVTLIHSLEGQVRTEGEAGYWRWRLEELEARRDKGEPFSPVELARACLGVGEADEAVVLLQQARDKEDPNLITLWTDPAWDRLRSDPRFREILTELRRRGSEDSLFF